MKNFFTLSSRVYDEDELMEDQGKARSAINDHIGDVEGMILSNEIWRSLERQREVSYNIWTELHNRIYGKKNA